MPSQGDIAVNMPVEHLDALSEVIKTGLKRAKISPEARKNLSSWWEAEKEFLDDSAAALMDNK